MARVRYLSSTRKPGLRFKVLAGRPQDPSDPANPNMTVTLEGAHGIRFDRTINDEIMERYGYTIEIVDEPQGA